MCIRDSIAIIDHGKIIVTGSPMELKNNLGGDIITLSVQQEADISGLVEKIENVKEVKKQDDTYLVKAENGELTAPLIIEALRKKGYVVTKLSLTKPTLNEVYLDYTGKSMRDAEESKESFVSRRITMRRARGR